MKQPKFKPNDNKFLVELRQKVHQKLKTHKESSHVLFIKCLALVAGFFACLIAYWILIPQSSLALVLPVILGILSLPIVLNIGHEAVHNTFSKHRYLNRLGRMVFSILGTSAYFWELRHIYSHHAYANVNEWDMDIEQSKIIRLSPNQQFKSHHRYQHLYMPFAFLTYTLIWFFVRDFKDMSTGQFGIKKNVKHPKKEIIKLLIAKIFHVSSFFTIPLVLDVAFPTALLGFILFHISASAITTFALISTHIGESQEVVSNSVHLPFTWAEHQLQTTADFATKCKLTTHFFGGFNHHVAHHFFPNVSHTKYHLITPEIRSLAKKYGYPYHAYKNLFQTSLSHLRRLKTLSVEPNF